MPMPLHFRSGLLELPNNRILALHRLRGLKTRMQKDQRYFHWSISTTRISQMTYCNEVMMNLFPKVKERMVHPARWGLQHAETRYAAGCIWSQRELLWRVAQPAIVTRSWPDKRCNRCLIKISTIYDRVWLCSRSHVSSVWHKCETWKLTEVFVLELQIALNYKSHY